MGNELLGLIPLLEVKSCERSIAFCRLLGFEVVTSEERDGSISWASLKAGDASLMLGRYEQLDPSQGQHAIMCLAVADVGAFRERLTSLNIRASELEYPDYAPHGQFSVCDENGYLFLISQGAG